MLALLQALGGSAEIMRLQKLQMHYMVQHDEVA